MARPCERPARRVFLFALGAIALGRAGAQQSEVAEPLRGVDSARLIVELIVFRQPQSLPTTVPEATEPAHLAPGVEVLPATSLQLERLAAGLRRRGYAVLGHGACLLPVPPGSSQGLKLEELLPGGGLTGKVSVTRGQNLFLHVTASSTATDGSTASLNERRRVKYGERHYFDGEVLAAIATVTPLRGAKR